MALLLQMNKRGSSNSTPHSRVYMEDSLSSIDATVDTIWKKKRVMLNNIFCVK